MLRDQGSLSDEDVKTVVEVVTHGGERMPRKPISRWRPSAVIFDRGPTARRTSGPCVSMI